MSFTNFLKTFYSKRCLRLADIDQNVLFRDTALYFVTVHAKQYSVFMFCGFLLLLFHLTLEVHIYTA